MDVMAEAKYTRPGTHPTDEDAKTIDPMTTDVSYFSWIARCPSRMRINQFRFTGRYDTVQYIF